MLLLSLPAAAEEKVDGVSELFKEFVDEAFEDVKNFRVEDSNGLDVLIIFFIYTTPLTFYSLLQYHNQP